MRPNLLIVNAGPKAFDFDVPDDRNWDWYDLRWSNGSPLRKRADAYFTAPDASRRKFELTSYLFGSRLDYDAICFADDDAIPVTGWDGIFDAFHATRLHVGHPAVTLDSHWAHEIVVEQRGISWRETNFIEIVAPILTGEAYARYSPKFEGLGQSWGIEVLFSTREAERGRNLAMLDAAPIRHVRPIGRSYDVEECTRDMSSLFARENLKPIWPHRTLKVH